MAGAKPRSNKGEANKDGVDYQLYTLMHCIDCLRKNGDVKDYTIGYAVPEYIALDDVVFTATLKQNEVITTAIQVKHSVKQMDENYLCRDSRTFLYKYLDSLTEAGKTIKQIIHPILWTNMKIGKEEWFDRINTGFNKILGGEENGLLNFNCYKIKEGSHRKYIMDRNHEYMQKQNNKPGNTTKKKEHSAKEWKDFFDQLVFYVEVPNVKVLKTNLIQTRNNLLGQAKKEKYFDDLSKLIEKVVSKQTTTNDTIDKLYILASLRNSMETGPYTNMSFKDLGLKGLQTNVEKAFEENVSNLLFVRATRDVECTVARLITVIENSLKFTGKKYLTVNYSTFIEKWETEFQSIVKDPNLTETDLKCLIISSINDIEENELLDKTNKLSQYNEYKENSHCLIIFVGSDLKKKSVKETDSSSSDNELVISCLDDDFDVNFLDDYIKSTVGNRKIQLLSEDKMSKSLSRPPCQTATMAEIFGEKLFFKENHFMVLELYTLKNNSILQVKVNQPSPTNIYQSRVAKLSPRGYTSETIDLLETENFSKLVIYDQAGMGKTTEMIKLASDFRAKHPNHLVLYLHCQAAVSESTSNLEDLICNTVKTCCALSNHVVKKMVQLGKLILILDGYDEVSQRCNEKLKSLVSEASRAGLSKLYIASRPHCMDEIKNVMGECGLCYLEPFSESDQLEYLKKFWKDKNVNIADAVIEEYARNIIKHFQLMMDGKFIIGIPLQTYMIAEIYKNRISDSTFHVSEYDSLGFMYKEFVELKFKEFDERNFDPTKASHEKDKKDQNTTFWNYHVEAALTIDKGYQAVLELDSLFKNKPDQQSEAEALCQRIEPYGLVILIPAESFIHYSYLEYFLARYILNYSADVRLIKHYISRYVDRYDSLVYRFMDFLLGNEINQDVEPNRSLYKWNRSNECFTEYIPPETSRLHCDKMKEFYGALYEIDALIITNLFSSLIYHQFFNLSEVIYDSLRVEIRSQVRLCLDAERCGQSKDKVCFHFEYSKNVDSLIPILNILLLKNPDTFFTLYFSGRNFSYKLDNHQRIESLLELMCDPSCSKLFDWLKEIIPKLNTKQQAALKLIVRRHLERCLMQVMRYENVEFLEVIIIWAKETWAPEATNHFLKNVNFLSLFIKNIEFGVSESSEPIRMEMVRKVFDFYHWAVGGRTLLNSELISAFNMVKSSTIKNLFRNLYQFD